MISYCSQKGCLIICGVSLKWIDFVLVNIDFSESLYYCKRYLTLACRYTYDTSANHRQRGSLVHTTSMAT